MEFDEETLILSPHPDTDEKRARLREEGALRAQQLKARRMFLGLSVREAAIRLGVSYGRYFGWERFLSAKVAAGNMTRLASVLDLSDAWLRGEVQEKDAFFSTSMLQETRVLLARRAKTRRKRLGLSAVEVAQSIGINPVTLNKWEQTFPRYIASEHRSNWESVLRVGPGWFQALRENPSLTNKEANLFGGAQIDGASSTSRLGHAVIAGSTVAEEVRAVGAWLCRQPLIHRTTDLGELSSRELRCTQIFAQRYGVAGHERSTLQAVGTAFGLTRERVRQIVARMLDHLQGTTIEAAQISRLGRDLEPLLPMSLREADHRFRAQLGEDLSLLDVDTFAREVLGRSFFQYVGGDPSRPGVWTDDHLLPAGGGDDALIRAVRDKSIEMIRANGAAHVFFVAGAVGEVLARGVTPDEVRSTLKLITDLQWLNEEDGWFWFGESTENRLLTVAKKMLTAARGRLDVEEILAGAMHSRRYFTNTHALRNGGVQHVVEPPWEIVREVLSATSWCKTIQYNDFVLIEESKEDGVLSEVEKALLAKIRKEGGVVSYRALKKAIMAADLVKGTSLSVSLDNSPLAYKPDWGLVAVRGVPFQGDALERARREVGGAAQEPRSNFPDGNGFFHFTTTLAKYVVNARYWCVPQMLSKHLGEGDYKVQGFEQTVRVHRYASSDTRFNGLAAKVIAMGFKIGDQVTLKINPSARLIVIDRP